jgi:hypothetical protein
MSLNNSSQIYVGEISLPWGELGGIMSWCKKNLQSEWKIEIISAAGEKSGVYRFTFDSLLDYNSFQIWMKLTCMH